MPRLTALAVLAAAAFTAAPLVSSSSVSASASASASPAAAVTVEQGQVHQVVNGFGFSEAFREPVIAALPQAEIQQIGQDLFSATAGAGMSIIRFGLGGAADPGDPIQGPGDVSDQVWLGHLAKQFGVRQFYADAWSAPARFKTNDSLDNGGYLCGVPGETCASGDTRPGYAAYLAGQAKGFAQAGIPLKAVDFVNESEIGPAYASMYMTPAQAANFVPYLGRALRAAHLPTTVACCDAEGWLDAPASGTTPAFDGGQAFNLSKRYWAFAAFGRFIRPGAVRLGATSGASGLEVSAFRNRDGSRVAEILNTGTTDQQVTLRGLGDGRATAYVTNETDSVTPVTPVTGLLTVPARSLLTVVTG